MYVLISFKGPILGYGKTERAAINDTIKNIGVGSAGSDYYLTNINEDPCEGDFVLLPCDDDLSAILEKSVNPYKEEYFIFKGRADAYPF